MFKFFSPFKTWLEALLNAPLVLADSQQRIEEALRHLEAMLAQKFLTPAEMAALNPHFHRNFLPNDDSAVQKNLVATWRLRAPGVLSHSELVESAFRVFSQNDEDGILLRLFTHIGHTNRYVIEIGSNCSGSDVGIPENLSANLIVNHGWHGSVFEMDPTECDRMRFFFARDHATRHFHWARDGENTYFSPLIIQQAVSPENINQVLIKANNEPEPDLMVIDIDGGDYAVIQNLEAVKPRVLVVEFEKRFRERYSVVQIDRANFSQRWQQSGSASLPAWEKLLGARGYTLCAVGSCGFNAFFVRSDVAVGKLSSLTAVDAFNSHPIFSRLSEDFWLTPDETWQAV
ncbi:MAG TPA: FkbM family methyltransferase [Sulfuriferula sp.]|nr:FkbM family methyltransferase [Sulfuriferula sp.]